MFLVSAAFFFFELWMMEVAGSERFVALVAYLLLDFVHLGKANDFIVSCFEC